MLLSEEEAKIKAQLWYSENADFLKEQESEAPPYLYLSVGLLYYVSVHLDF